MPRLEEFTRLLLRQVTSNFPMRFVRTVRKSCANNAAIPRKVTH
jgi:hypothetical protein